MSRAADAVATRHLQPADRATYSNRRFCRRPALGVTGPSFRHAQGARAAEMRTVRRGRPPAGPSADALHAAAAIMAGTGIPPFGFARAFGVDSAVIGHGTASPHDTENSNG